MSGHFSEEEEEEWAWLDPDQRALHREVIEKNLQNMASLGGYLPPPKNTYFRGTSEEGIEYNHLWLLMACTNFSIQPCSYDHDCPVVCQQPHVPLDKGGLSSGGHASPQTRFQIDEYDYEDTFPIREKAPQEHKLTWKADGASSPGSPASYESLSPGQQEPRSRIGSFPPLLESDTSDELGAFRARSHSAPPVLLAAQRYGRELRRMSDEFHGELQKMPRPKSAGTAFQMQQTSSWKETLQWWWRRSFPGNGPPWNPT